MKYIRFARGTALATACALLPQAAGAAAAGDQGTNADDIVVTASAREQQVKTAPASISAITRETLERMPYREITDALLEVPGVTVTTGEGNSRDISIRGMDPKYTLILVDGRRLSSRESRTNGGNISEGGLLPPLEAIERIEVVRGPMSSLYGSDAMGGVVNVITRRISDHWRGSARVNGTLQLGDKFGDYADGNFYLSGPITEGLGLQMQGSMNRRREDRVVGGTPERKDESLAGKLGWNIGPDHEFLAEAGYYRQYTRATAGKTVEITATVPEGTETIQTQKRLVGALSHTGRWGFATSNSYVQYEDAKNPEAQKRIRNWVGQSIWSVPLPGNALSVGAYFRTEDLKDLTGNRLSGATRTGTSRRQFAFFAENELKLLDGFSLTGGLRMDDDQQYGTNWTPRIYAVWTATKAITVKGGYSRGFRAPNLRETLYDWGQTSRGGTIYGNPDLDPETSRTIEASVILDLGKVQASLSAYDTRFHDKITRITCAAAGAWCTNEPLSTIGRPPTTYVNVDEAKVRGIEATLDLPITRTLKLVTTGTLTDSKQLTGANAGSALNDTPKQQASASLNWKPTKRISAFARAVFRGQEAVTEAQISGESIVAKSYTTVDVGGSFRVNHALTVHGGIQNLFDKRLAYDDYAYVIDPARIWLGLQMRF